MSGYELQREMDQAVRGAKLRAIADEAVGLLAHLGFWGLDRSKEAELHATALGLRARLATVDQMGPETGLSATQGVQDGETAGTDGAEVQDGPEALDAAMSSIWLHGNWRSLTRNMTTEEKTAAADAVDRAHMAIKDDDECAAIRAERWWLDA